MTNATNPTFSAALRGLAAEAGLSWAEIARRAELDEQTVRGAMGGRTASPRIETLEAILKVIGVDREALITRHAELVKRR